ncbi:MAG: response regulator [Verrucomicrobia bacterium]|nr:response regulator [Verrucomicrobiota bacterium]
MSGLIMLVEDNENDVFFFKRAMIPAGLNHPLRVAPNGRDAIDYLDGHGKYADRTEFPLPRLVLLDLKLPEVSGLEVLKWIRSQGKFNTLVVVMLAASHLDDAIPRAYALGANSFLVKPSSLDELAKMLRLIKEYWLELNRQPPPHSSLETRPKQETPSN